MCLLPFTQEDREFFLLSPCLRSRRPRHTNECAETRRGDDAPALQLGDDLQGFRPTARPRHGVQDAVATVLRGPELRVFDALQ